MTCLKIFGQFWYSLTRDAHWPLFPIVSVLLTGTKFYISILKPTRCTISQIYVILEQHSTFFEQFLCPSSGVWDCTYSINYMPYRSVDCLLASIWHIPDAVCTVLDSWWWTERPSETCTALFQNKINLRYCVSGWFYYRNILRRTVLQTDTKFYSYL
jgi:hypothetical protein